jgi:hypothetical protein
LQVTLRKEMECHFANAAVPGGSTSSLQMESEYAELLGLPIKPSYGRRVVKRVVIHVGPDRSGDATRAVQRR